MTPPPPNLYPQRTPPKRLTCSPVAAFHVERKPATASDPPHPLSPDPLTTRFPSGEKATTISPLARPVAGHSGFTRWRCLWVAVHVQLPVLVCPIVSSCRACHRENLSHNQSALRHSPPSRRLWVEVDILLLVKSADVFKKINMSALGVPRTQVPPSQTPCRTEP